MKTIKKTSSVLYMLFMFIIAYLNLDQFKSNPFTVVVPAIMGVLLLWVIYKYKILFNE